MSNIKNNMYKLPIYIPNYDLTDNKEVKQKTDKNYKYSYVNIDSMYRQTKDIYDYSQYFYLANNRNCCRHTMHSNKFSYTNPQNRF